MKDIYFKDENGIFSYRVAGICVHNGKVLLQKPFDDDGYAIPGGHVAFGETNAETLSREFAEEIGARITVGELQWVAEIFFPWEGRMTHQICLYYMVEIDEETLPAGDSFVSKESGNIQFFWLPLSELDRYRIYPVTAVELLGKLDDGQVVHFIDREES